MTEEVNTQATELIEATCPECRGPLSLTVQDGRIGEYHCLVGHRYSARTLLEGHSETQERTLWAAVVALEESAKLVEAIAPQFPPAVADRLRQQAEKKARQARQIRDVLENLEPFQTE